MMKHWMKFLILFFILSMPCMAKIKVTQKSAKKPPVWVNTTQPDYIITSAIEGDIERAKNVCIDQVRKYIIDAVAQNVKSTSENDITQETVNNEITRFLDKYHYSSQTQSANLPYLTGISASKVEDSYWEKREDSDTKEVSFLYCIKYPFPRLELKKLVHEFTKKDAEMNNRLASLEKAYQHIHSVEQIGEAVSALTGLADYFFDDIRKKSAQRLQQNYRKLYKQIGIREIANELGDYTFALVLRGKPITASPLPVLKSETLTQLRAEQQDSIWRVRYNYETCSASEENSGIIGFRFGGYPLNHRFYVDVEQKSIHLAPMKEVYLTATRRDSLLSGITVRMNLNVGKAQQLKIYAITLDVPGLDKPLFIDNLGLSVTGSGMQTLQTTFGGTALLLKAQNYRSNLLKGHLEVLDEKNNIHRVDFSLPFKANW
ncbi:hypothetical protein [Odoribacter lunatus]|uniref:hypothetical protein n=1 Tax=Odoribacter lunatus TaxID=2941335 RepID=UPI0020401E3C|nr:hypothetical protein [Odoribacter lunatus]